METVKEKKIGVWMDHTKAHFIYISNGAPIVETAYSDEEGHLRFKGEHGDGVKLGNHRSTNNEHHKHDRKRDAMKRYYGLLADRIKNYDDIYLFGPTLAKDELYNHLKSDKHFSNKVLKVEAADHLTENQMVARVKHFFNV